jgi:hypothetical protein
MATFPQMKKRPPDQGKALVCFGEFKMKERQPATDFLPCR